MLKYLLAQDQYCSREFLEKTCAREDPTLEGTLRYPKTISDVGGHTLTGTLNQKVDYHNILIVN
jgi:hypothetical protein